MSKPTILAVDDDPGAVAAIARDLRTRYGADYQVVRTTSGAEALELWPTSCSRPHGRAVVPTRACPG